MSPIDVRIEDVWKQYRLSTRRHAPAFWALQGITLDVPRGSATGIIGRNGAGKSTLLKLLAGITAPTRGRLTIDGRLAALIEVGSGFHPELTGRENVFLSGAILGMRRRDIVAKLPLIVDFAGVGDFLDTPVKWYSSGMYVRLGFSVAAHLDPDILLVDEVLAVGDAEFQARCMRRVHELKTRGVTIILISHDLTAVERLCDRAVLLDHGGVEALGEPREVVAAYHHRINGIGAADDPRSLRRGEPFLSLTNLTLDTRNDPVAMPRTGEPLSVMLRYAATKPLRVRVQLSYYSADGRSLVARTAAGADGPGVDVLPPGGTIEFTCPLLPLAPGSYYVGAVAFDAHSGDVLSWWDGGTVLNVNRGIETEGQMLIPHEWRVHHADASGADSILVVERRH
jgi:ABC-type polysaccharide/polyol phosphate transport system ATPase subunit